MPYFLFCPLTQARVVTLQYTGIVSAVEPELASVYAAGNPVRGAYSYDSSRATWDVGDRTSAQPGCSDVEVLTSGGPHRALTTTGAFAVSNFGVLPFVPSDPAAPWAVR